MILSSRSTSPKIPLEQFIQNVKAPSGVVPRPIANAPRLTGENAAVFTYNLLGKRLPATTAGAEVKRPAGIYFYTSGVRDGRYVRRLVRGMSAR